MLDGLVTQLAADVQSKSGGEAVKIRSAAMDVRDETPSVVPMEAVTNLAVTMGDGSGELDAHRNPVQI